MKVVRWMGAKRKRNPNGSSHEVKLRLPLDLVQSMRMLASARNQSLNAYALRALRNQILTDGASMESDTVLRLVEQGSQHISRGVNYAAVTAQATLLLVKQLLLERRLADGLPRDIAEGQVEALADAAMAEAEAVYADPRTRAAYAWVEREDPEAFAERLLEGVAEDEDLED